MRSVLIGSEYPVTGTPHFLFPEKFILQTHICVQYQKNPFYFVIYSNSYKIAKKWLRNCRGGVVNSKDAGLRPLCERNATMKRGRGQTLGYFSPCGKEERKISDISRRTLVIGANLLVAELRPDAAPDMVSKCRVEKMKAARKLYVSFFLLEILSMPVFALLFFIAMPHDIAIQQFQAIKSITDIFPVDTPLVIFPIYAFVSSLIVCLVS